MKEFLFFAVFAGASAVYGELVPEISNVRVTQKGNSSVSVMYDLAGADGIVTVDFLTNGVSIGQSNIGGLKGEVNKLVEKGTDRSFFWRPASSWPDSVRIKEAVLTARVTAWTENAPPDYLVVDLDAPTDHRYYETAAAVPLGVTNVLYKTSKVAFRRIHAANMTFPMGSPADEPGHGEGNAADDLLIGLETVHMVTLTNDFYLGVYELTQEQYRRIKDEETLGGYFTEGDEAAVRPRDSISKYHLTEAFHHPASFANRAKAEPGSLIGKFRGKTGLSRCILPTDAEWEFACRAGEYDAFYWGGGLSTDEEGAYLNGEIDEYAWYEANSGGTTHPVGTKKPNAWGLYDMIGNVAEMTLDLARTPNYSQTPPYPPQEIDPIMDYETAGYSAWEEAGCVRGGSWWEPITHCRSASRTVPKVTWGSNGKPNAGRHMGARLAIRLD